MRSTLYVTSVKELEDLIMYFEVGRKDFQIPILGHTKSILFIDIHIIDIHIIDIHIIDIHIIALIFY